MTTQALFEELEGAEKKWLALSEYSNKYKMSISTLRRRIKANQISFQLKGGKYYIANSSPTKHILTSPSEKHFKVTAHRPSKSQVAKDFSELEDPFPPSAPSAHLLEEMQKILSRIEQTNKKSLLENRQANSCSTAEKIQFKNSYKGSGGKTALLGTPNEIKHEIKITEVGLAIHCMSLKQKGVFHVPHEKNVSLP